MTGAWRTRTVLETYPEPVGTVEEEERYWDADAEPDCARCLDAGRWVAPSDTVEPCPDCSGGRA